MFRLNLTCFLLGQTLLELWGDTDIRTMPFTLTDEEVLVFHYGRQLNPLDKRHKMPAQIAKELDKLFASMIEIFPEERLKIEDVLETCEKLIAQWTELESRPKNTASALNFFSRRPPISESVTIRPTVIVSNLDSRP